MIIPVGKIKQQKRQGAFQHETILEQFQRLQKEARTPLDAGYDELQNKQPGPEAVGDAMGQTNNAAMANAVNDAKAPPVAAEQPDPNAGAAPAPAPGGQEANPAGDNQQSTQNEIVERIVGVLQKFKMLPTPFAAMVTKFNAPGDRFQLEFQPAQPKAGPLVAKQ
jgi:hypothetical protein